MKKFFFIISAISFSFVSAQENGKLYSNIMSPMSNSNTTSFSKIYKTKPTTQLVPQLKLNYTVSNSKKVYLVPQNNMLLQNNMPWVSADTPKFIVRTWCNNFQDIGLGQPQKQIEPLTSEKLKELRELLNKSSKNTN